MQSPRLVCLCENSLAASAGRKRKTGCPLSQDVQSPHVCRYQDWLKCLTIRNSLFESMSPPARMSALHLNSLYFTLILHHCFSPFIYISFRHPSRSPPVLNSKFVCIHRSVLESLPAHPVLHEHSLISDLSVVWPVKNTVSLRNHLKKQRKKKNHNPFASSPLCSNFPSAPPTVRCDKWKCYTSTRAPPPLH